MHNIIRTGALRAGFVAALLATTVPVMAAPALLAVGTWNGSSDLSGLPGNLENGNPPSLALHTNMAIC